MVISGLCGEKTELLTSSDSGKYHIDWYSKDCGATTAYRSQLILRNENGNEVTFLKGIGEPKISADWSSSSVSVVVQGVRDYEILETSLRDEFDVEVEIFSDAEKLLRPLQTIEHPSKEVT